MTEKTAAAPAAEKAPKPEPKYKHLSANFMAPRATFKGRLKAVMKAFKESGNDIQNGMVQDFRNALAAGDIALPTEAVSHQQATQLAQIAIQLPAELLPKAKEAAAPAADAPEGSAGDVTSAV